MAIGHSMIPLPPAGLGHAFTASAGWHTLQGARWLLGQSEEDSLWVPVWGLHHQVAALRLRKTGRPQLAVAPRGTVGNCLAFAMDANLNDLKQLLIENCSLRLAPEQISETMPLFEPAGLGLDSIDALQLAVAVEKKYGFSIKNAEVAREALQSLGALRDWIGRQP